MGSPSRDEDGIPKTLHNGVAMHSILLQQAVTQLFIKIPTLVMDGVMVLLNGLTTFPGHLHKPIIVTSRAIYNQCKRPETFLVLI